MKVLYLINKYSPCVDMIIVIFCTDLLALPKSLRGTDADLPVVFYTSESQARCISQRCVTYHISFENFVVMQGCVHSCSMFVLQISFNIEP